MRIRRNRIISGILAFVMAAAMVLQVLPSIEVSAAGGGISITLPFDTYNASGTGMIDIEEMHADSIQITWTACLDASVYKLSVKNSSTGEKITMNNGEETEIIGADKNRIYYLNTAELDYSTEYIVYIGAYESETSEWAIGDYWNTVTFITCDKL